MKSTWVRSGLASLVAVAAAVLVVACGGGSDGAAGPQGPAGPAGPPGAGNGVTVGSNTLTNTDAIAVQAAQWAALQPTVTINSVSIASPPVITFNVTDAFGNPVLGLGNTSKVSANKYPTYPNVAFALAKLVPASNGSPSRWANYIVTLDETAAGVVTLTLPRTEANGTLVDHQDGSYTYTFRRDITTMAAAVADPAQTAAAAGANRADLGRDLTYDPNATHRLTIALSGNAPGTGTNRPNAVQLVPGVPMKKPVNLTYDFVPASGQAATPDKTRVVVANAKCEACHQRLGGIPGATANPGEAADFHGGNRNNVQYCAVCHTDQQRYGFSEAPATTNGAVQTFTNTVAATATAPARPDTRVVGGRAIGNLPNYIHKKHVGPLLVNQNYNFAGVAFNETTYPQDIRNCTNCHDGGNGTPDPAKNQTPQGDNWKTVPNTLACGSCHDGINFATGAGVTIADAAKGLTVSPNGHVGGPVTDDLCVVCHKPTFQNIDLAHLPVTPPNPQNSLDVALKQGPDTGNSNTNAAWIASGSSVDRLPQGAIRVTYDIKSVSRNASKQPVMVFRLLQNCTNTDVTKCTSTNLKTFNPPATGVDPYQNLASQEIWDNFMGAPSVYFVFAVKQDGINTPADFNVTYSSYLRSIWNGTACVPDPKLAPPATTPTSCATLSAPDATGYYTVTFTGVTVPDTAVMLTGGLGYSYSARTSLPLTQIGGMVDASGQNPYPATVSPLAATQTCAAAPIGTACSPELLDPRMGNKRGGLIVIAPNVQKVATGYTGRRAIVEDARCNKCHQELGTFTEDAFHAGQRNDGTTCSWCHRPNQTSSGWSADSTYYVHAIHAANKRTNKFVWHAGSTTDGFWDIGFPGILNNCEGCHLPDTYAFNTPAQQTALGASDNIDKRLYRTVATGIFNGNAGTLTTGCTVTTINDCLATTVSVFSLSPWVVKDNTLASSYGAGFSTNSSTAAPTDAAGTTLVMSPTVSVCSACHDSADAISHFKIMGAAYYQPRSTAITGTNETCLLCHGAGRVADIKLMHSTNK
jgi:OmcA/MtrC family decaheme c-type cytochrome